MEFFLSRKKESVLLFPILHYFLYRKSEIKYREKKNKERERIGEPSAHGSTSP